MTNSNKHVDYLKAQELLPWYADNTLSAEDNLWVSTQLKLHPSLNDELRLIKKQMSLTKDYINKLDTEGYVNNPQRLSHLVNKIQSQANKPAQNENLFKEANVKKKNFWQKLLSYLPESPRVWQMSGALALSIMVLQGVIISQLYKPQSSVEYTTLSEPSLAPSPQAESKLILLTRFDLKASIFQLDELLTQFNLSIIDGPDASGIYRLAVNDPISDEAIEQLILKLENQHTIIKFIAREH